MGQLFWLSPKLRDFRGFRMAKTPKNHGIFEKYAYFWRKILKNGYPFWPKSLLKMGMGFEARAAHPCPTQIWVPPRAGDLCMLTSLQAENMYGVAAVAWWWSFWPGSEMGRNLTSSPLVWGPGFVDDSASKMPCPVEKSEDNSGGFVSF